ncbi:hypothetical protein LOK49_LG09G02299 [Camellia lanceoleosa]|uniref:Uncharacterized protein n=1 Tax=Camellia lanceoleosa TaxID=1840588 RepID=A0ACC0GMR4_9ERIC|nr:hypothetical protein LOK49_LG09G02299 [Camellia lanceoleosa]
MAVLNLAENTLKPNRPQFYLQRANVTSLWAFLLSIFIYISIFYSFNLSPSTLLNTTKFWFFISNTLILIIAADFGAFSSSKTQSDLYEDYVKKSRANSFPSFESQYREIVETSTAQHKGESSQESPEKIKEVVVVHKSEFPENKLENFIKNDLERSSDNFQEKIRKLSPEVDNEAQEEKKNEARCVHSMSNRDIPAINNENKIILGKSENEKKEENEFSTMSDEDLKRRVEEFIQRSNKQIRLQAVQYRICQS